MKQYTDEARGKLFSFYNEQFLLKKSTGGYYRFDCFLCGGNTTMGINFSRSRLHCFRCGETLSPIDGVKLIKNLLTTSDVWKYLKDYQWDNSVSEGDKNPIQKIPIKLPTTFTPILTNTHSTFLGRAAIHYILKKRKLKLSQVIKAGVGFCTGGKYAGYIIFPYYNHGVLEFFQGRKFTELGTKMKNPEVSDFGVGKSEVLYNEDALYMYKTTYLVESVTNALTLGAKAFGINGKSLSPQQLYLILKSPCENVIIILDSDAYLQALSTALTLSPHKKVKLVKMPQNRDVNDLGRKNTLQLIHKETYKTYNEFFKQKLIDETPTIITYN